MERRARGRSVAAGLTVVAVGAILAVGCGGSMGQPTLSNDSVGSAEQEVDAAEARIGAALGGGTKSNPPPTIDNGTGNPNPTTPQPGPQPTTQVEPTTPDLPLDTEEDRCRVACDALTSMIRAVDRLCLITGQSDERCQSRRARADSASSRVVQSCPSCNV